MMTTCTPAKPMKEIKTKEGFRGIYLIHKHDATRLHYDLRLEMDGMLKSWAVPKEPSMDPKVKRLAIMVDDHALSYKDFEGTIEEGSYGAGTVKIWDKGKYTLQEISPKKVVITIDGKKLQGGFSLIAFPKAGKNNWLFSKAS